MKDRHEQALLKSGLPTADQTGKELQEKLDRCKVPVYLADPGQVIPFED